MDDKTNVMRLLEQKKIKYESYNYFAATAGTSDAMDEEELAKRAGDTIAKAMGQNPDCVFKTLVTTGKTGTHYVFVIPVNKELDLKKAAKAVGEKSIEMLRAKDLLGLTGYVHGGCSPIGMKKAFKTTIHTTAGELERIYFSAGRVGYQVAVAPQELGKIIRFNYADIVV